MSRRAQHVLPIAIALLLAGCASSNPPPADDGDGPFVQPGTAGAGEMTLLYDGLDEAVETTVWANGTVAFQDTCNTGGCVLSTDRAFHVTDITDELPPGVPVELTVNMQTTPHPMFGTFDVFLNAPDSVLYYDRTTQNHAAGTVLIQAMLRPAGTVEVILGANAPGGEMPETPYTLSIAIVAGPDRVSPGAPIGIELGPNANLTYRAPGQTNPEFFLYGPDDALLGTYAGHVTLPANAPSGEYVVLLPNGSQWGNLSSDQASTMRALGLAPELGPVGTLPPTGTYDASWEVDGFPFAVGFALFPASSGNPVGDPITSLGFEVAMSADNGFLLESGPICGICLSFGLSFVYNSGTGNPDVVAQTYDLHAQTQATYDLRIMPFALYLDRA